MSLDRLHVAAAVHALRPDFAVLALVVSGLTNGPSDTESDAWLRDAEAHARMGGAAVLPLYRIKIVRHRSGFRPPPKTMAEAEARLKDTYAGVA